jgi:dihydroflavonol-4-reductase
MAKVLVTGATGFIGSHLVESLLTQGDTVRCLVRPTSNLRWLPTQGIERIMVHTSLHSSLAPALTDVEIIYHLAGATKAHSVDDYQRHNVAFTRQLLECIIRQAPPLKRLVMTSSQAAVGPAAHGTDADEAMVCQPLTHYGKSKLASERLLGLFPDIPSVILRPVSVYGPRDRDVLSIIKMIQNRIAPILGSPERRLTFVYVEDLVQALILAAHKSEAIGKTYFVTDGETYTWRQVQTNLEQILARKALGIKIPTWMVYGLAFFSELGSRLTRTPTIFNLNKVNEILQDNWGCSSDKIQSDLGFSPQVKLADGLQKTIDWAKKHGWLK